MLRFLEICRNIWSHRSNITKRFQALKQIAGRYKVVQILWVVGLLEAFDGIQNAAKISTTLDISLKIRISQKAVEIPHSLYCIVLFIKIVLFFKVNRTKVENTHFYNKIKKKSEKREYRRMTSKPKTFKFFLIFSTLTFIYL